MSVKTTTKKPHVIAALLIAAAIVTVVASAGYHLLKQKIVQVNPLFVSQDAIVGVDVSHYQADVDMDVLAEQGMRFVYVKATEGATFTDQSFAQNWERAQESPLEVGAYHFFSFDSPGAVQARHYIEVVGSLDGALVPAVDIEWYGDKSPQNVAREDVVRELSACLAALEEEYGTRPMIYASRDVFDLYLAGEFNDYLLWVRSVLLPAQLEWGNTWTMWQYNDRGRLEGYSGGEQYIDLNVVNGGEEALARLRVNS